MYNGWPGSVDLSLQPYFSKKHDLSSHDGCVLWGTSVVVPLAECRRIFDDLHKSHQGVSRMKSRTQMVI